VIGQWIFSRGNSTSPMLEKPSPKTPTKSVGEDVEKKEPLYTAGGNASWCNHSGKKMEDS
jgi:hypothetical protein